MAAVHKILSSILLLPCAFGSSAWADYEKGMEAWERGDYTRARQEFLPEAKQGRAEAQFRLGHSYSFFGGGALNDFQKAAFWYRKAAEQNYAPAQYELGYLYGTGQGVSKDKKEAVAWYRRAAGQGFAPAQFQLGLAYATGQDVPKDRKKAVSWFHKAAEQGDEEAQYWLGSYYLCESERGCASKNLKEALTWLHKSAAQGFLPSCFKLGFLYESVQPIQDQVLAYAFYFLAANNPLEYAEAEVPHRRDSLVKKLTPDQITQGQALAAEWKRGVVLTNGRSLEETLALLDEVDRK